MDDYWYWELKFHISFASGKRDGTFTVDRQNATTSEMAQKELISAYKDDPFRLVNGSMEEGNHELVINSCSKVSPDLPFPPSLLLENFALLPNPHHQFLEAFYVSFSENLVFYEIGEYEYK